MVCVCDWGGGGGWWVCVGVGKIGCLFAAVYSLLMRIRMHSIKSDLAFSGSFDVSDGLSSWKEIEPIP